MSGFEKWRGEIGNGEGGARGRTSVPRSPARCSCANSFTREAIRYLVSYQTIGVASSPALIAGDAIIITLIRYLSKP